MSWKILRVSFCIIVSLAVLFATPSAALANIGYSSGGIATNNASSWWPADATQSDEWAGDWSPKYGRINSTYVFDSQVNYAEVGWAWGAAIGERDDVPVPFLAFKDKDWPPGQPQERYVWDDGTDDPGVPNVHHKPLISLPKNTWMNFSVCRRWGTRDWDFQANGGALMTVWKLDLGTSFSSADRERTASDPTNYGSWNWTQFRHTTGSSAGGWDYWWYAVDDSTCNPKDPVYLPKFDHLFDTNHWFYVTHS